MAKIKTLYDNDLTEISPKTVADAVIVNEEGNTNLKEYLDEENNIGYYSTKINVKDYGIMGDGITNDAIKLREIFTNTINNTEIYFPNGTYLLGGEDYSDNIALELLSKNNIKITGESKENTKIIVHENTSVGTGKGIFYFYRCENIILENFELDGNLQLRHQALGSTWSDTSDMNRCSNIDISGGKNIIIRNIFSHHPVMDNISIGRHAGGNTPNGEIALIKDCELTYGYRQGISIVGFNNGIIKNCTISNTAKALSLIDGTTELGTSPRSAIDSETWATNYNWKIEECTFENNYINMNDGTVNFYFDKCTFNNSDFISETPSAGMRTYNIKCFNNKFIDSIIKIHNKGFIFDSNFFELSSSNVKIFAFLWTGGYNNYLKGAKNTVFKNNIIKIVQEDETNPVIINNIIYPYLQADISIINNVFIDCYFNANLNSNNYTILGNLFYTTDTSKLYIVSDTKMYENNNFSSSSYILKNKIKKSFICNNDKGCRIKLFSTDITSKNYENNFCEIKITITPAKFSTTIITEQNINFKVEYYLNDIKYLYGFEGQKFQGIKSYTNLDDNCIPLLSNIYIENDFYYINILNTYSSCLNIDIECTLNSTDNEILENTYSKNILVYEDYNSYSDFLTDVLVYTYKKTYNLNDIIVFGAYGKLIKYKCTQAGNCGQEGYMKPNIIFNLNEEFTLGECKFKAIERLDGYNNQNINLNDKAVTSDELKNKYYYIKFKNGDILFNKTLNKPICFYNNKWYDFSGTQITL